MARWSSLDPCVVLLRGITVLTALLSQGKTSKLLEATGSVSCFLFRCLWLFCSCWFNCGFQNWLLFACVSFWPTKPLAFDMTWVAISLFPFFLRLSSPVFDSFVCSYTVFTGIIITIRKTFQQKSKMSLNNSSMNSPKTKKASILIIVYDQFGQKFIWETSPGKQLQTNFRLPISAEWVLQTQIMYM